MLVPGTLVYDEYTRIIPQSKRAEQIRIELSKLNPQPSVSRGTGIPMPPPREPIIPSPKELDDYRRELEEYYNNLGRLGPPSVTVPSQVRPRMPRIPMPRPVMVP
jgi:hypothetical protein